jgi:hypothetical protein
MRKINRKVAGYFAHYLKGRRDRVAGALSMARITANGDEVSDVFRWLRIKDLKPVQLPLSHNAKFAEGWAGPRLDDAELSAVAERMAK